MPASAKGEYYGSGHLGRGEGLQEVNSKIAATIFWQGVPPSTNSLKFVPCSEKSGFS